MRSFLAVALVYTSLDRSRAFVVKQTYPAAATCSSYSLLRAAEEECSLDDDEIFACLAATGYTESTEMHINRVFVANIENLSDFFPSFETPDDDGGSNMIKYQRRRRQTSTASRKASSTASSTASETSNGQSIHTEDRSTPTNSHVANLEYMSLIDNDQLVLVDAVRTNTQQPVSRAFVQAGPRKRLHFDPAKVNASIVTCGGLCPGLNNVIRELVHSLYYLYGVKKVYGVTGGFHGFDNDSVYDPVMLSNEMVENIHHEGGTILRSSRGGFDLEKIVGFLREHDIQQLYVIGGDGTHRAAYKIHQACQLEKIHCAVAGIPKTIDNDCDYIDRSFGFVSAVEAAQNSIRIAKTEAMCNVPNGIGIIKLMGRSAGFLAAFAALGSGDVDAVLLPEVPIVLDGPDGILPFLRQRVKEQKYAVVVVAEGAGEELLGESSETDAGGNKKLPPIGSFIKEAIEEYFEEQGEEATVKYIDPSYTVRSVPANAADSLYCLQLAQNAVHGAMAGFTGFSVGLVNNRVVYLPIPMLVATSPRTLATNGQTWERILAMTGQPNTAKAADSIETGNSAEVVDFPMLPEPTLH